VSRTARWEALHVIVGEVVCGTGRIDARPPQRLVAEQVASPAMRDWSMIIAFTRRTAPGAQHPQLGQGQREGVRTSRSSSGSSSTAPRRRGSRRKHRPAVGERRPNRCQAGSALLLA
jgi:hypothetical protein